MVDIAALGLTVDSGSLIKGTESLDKFTKAANDAGKASDKPGIGSRKSAEGVKRLDDAAQGATRSLSSMGNTAARIGATITAAFSVAKIAAAADTYTRFTNQLKVAGLEGENLAVVQEKLFAISQKYGTSVESLGSLYGRLSQAAGELGASQAQLQQFTTGVAAALKVQGGGAAETSGALIQLSQALGGAIVRAEEFNSINEGARPIVQAVANGIDRFGGSVSKLRAEVIKGNVTSQEFFQGFLKGSGQLETQAAKSVMTLSQSMTTLSNSFVMYVGELDKSLAASATFGKVISTLANNIDTIAKIVGALAAIFAIRLVASVSAATVALVANAIAANSAAASYNAMTLSSTRAVGAMGALAAGARGAGASMLAAFGGPIGLAITGVIAALGLFAYKIGEVERSSQSLRAEVDAQTQATANLRLEQNKANAEAGNLSATQKAAQTATANLTGEAHLLANAWARVAAEAKAAAIEQARAAKTKAALAWAEARNNTRAVENDRPGIFGMIAANGFDISPKGEAKVRAQQAKRVAEARALEKRQLENFKVFRDEEAKINSQRLADFKSVGAAAAAPASASTGRGGKSSERAAGLSKEAQALEDRNKKTIDFIKSLEDETRKIGLNDKALRALEITQAKEVATNDAQRAAIEKASQAREAAIKLAKQQQEVEAANKELEEYRKGTLASLDIELQTMDMVGVARDQEILRLQHQAEMQALTARLRAAEIDGNVKLVESLQALMQAQEEGYAKKAMVNNFNQAKEEADKLNQSLSEMISLLQGIGGLGGAIGGVLGGLVNGQFSGLGKAGGILNIAMKPNEYAKQADKIGERIEKVFGVSGEFAKTMGAVLQNAALGAAAGTAIGGNKGAASQALGAVGGALGGAAGKALGAMASNAIGGALGSALGSAIPVVGTILGGVLGNVIGGMFKKTKWGRVDVSGVSGDFNTRGNSGKSQAAATEAGGSIVDALKKIANDLGGVAGEFASIAVGVRDGKWRVNTTGTSLKTSKGAKDFGEDQSAAIAYAVQQAIKKGAIDGINASVMNLLTASGDFETQLNKASELSGIFAEIAASADPMGAELTALAKRFTSINALLVEANATQTEVDQVAAYQAQQEASIRARYAAEAAAKAAEKMEKEADLLELQGKATAALALRRKAELSQMDASLQALQKQIYAEEDAATVRALNIQLLEAEGKNLEATAASRAEILRATLDSNKALQNEIWLKQDLREAYNRESQALIDTSEKMKGFSESLREFRDSIYAGDEGAMSYVQALAKLMATGALASTGDEKALGKLPDVGKSFIDAAKSNAKSLLDVQRAQALTANYVDAALGYTDNAATVADQQLEAMKQSVGALINIEDSVLTVEEILAQIAGLNAPVTTNGLTPAQTAHNENIMAQIKALEDSMKFFWGSFSRSEKTQNKILALWEQLIPDGTSIRVSTWGDEPLNVTT